MLIYSFITDYQAFNLRYKDNTTRDKNETKVDKQSANLGKNNEPIQNRLSFLIDCKSVILHHLAILSFPMVRPAWDNWWLLGDLERLQSESRVECQRRGSRGSVLVRLDREVTSVSEVPLRAETVYQVSVCGTCAVQSLLVEMKTFCSPPLASNFNSSVEIVKTGFSSLQAASASAAERIKSNFFIIY